MRSRRIARAVVAGVVLAAVAAASVRGVTAATGPGVPAGQASPPFPAPECLTCHGVDLIEQQRLSAAGWAREVDKMVRWGAQVAPERKDALVVDLVARFGPAPNSAAPVPAGQDVYDRACLACHDVDLVEQQRLTPTGWTREVAKMVAWGAPVREDERATLAAYLAIRFPPR